jgi:hypothetical protein
MRGNINKWRVLFLYLAAMLETEAILQIRGICKFFDHVNNFMATLRTAVL